MSSRQAHGAALSVEVLVQSRRWNDKPRAPAAVKRAINAAADELSSRRGEVAVVLANDATLRKLNRQWRGIDKPTNVLSFPPSAVTPPKNAALGDIVIAYETLMRECRNEHKDFLHHLSHLAVHGFLHLIGYDHQNDSEAKTMEKLECAILARLRMPDPYLVRDDLG